VARLVVDAGADLRARLETARRDADRLVVADPVDVFDRCLGAVPDDDARIGNLAAALRIERALLQLHQHRPVVV
jgi:hypothetical protein